MAITAALVKELRDTTGAGMMDAKKALTETDGDMEAAVDWLRTKGLAKAAKKSGRTAPSMGANVYDILRRDTLVLTKAAVEALEARLS